MKGVDTIARIRREHFVWELAQLLRVKRMEIRRTEPVRCVIDTANDPHEISLDENVTREAMHPADQFEAFRALAEHRGWAPRRSPPGLA